MTYPSSIFTEWVRGQFLVGTIDGADADQVPEADPAQGTVTFVASVPYLPVPTNAPNPVTILPEPRVAVLDDQGYLCTPAKGTLTPAYQGMRLESTNDPSSSVVDWTWTATYKFTNSTKQIPSHSFALQIGSPVDLTTVVQVPASGGIGTEQAEALAASAAAAATTAANAATAAQAAATAAAAEASANDAGVTNLITTGGTTTRTAVTDLVASSNSAKLDATDAASTYQPISTLGAAVAAQASTTGTGTNTAVKAIADASAATAAGPKLDASQKGAASGIATLDTGGKHPLTETPDVLKTDTGVKPVGKGELFVNTNDYASIAAAHTANPAVATLSPANVNVGSVGNIYGINYNKALGAYQQAGTAATPTTDAAPIVWTHKYSAADRPGVMANEWSQGAYHQITKMSGGAYDAAITGYVRNQGGTGQSIGIHGRASGYTADSDVFGIWAYAAAANASIVPKSIIGIELDMNNMCADQGWMDGANVGASRGLLVVGADNSNPLTHGIEVGAGNSSPNGKFWTGLLMRANGTMPAGANSATQVNNGEQIRLGGATSSADSYNGIRFYGGNYAVGLSFAEASYGNNAAILMGDGHRIVVGPGAATSTYVGFNKTGSNVNFNNFNIAINGTQVLKSRRTGWGAATGTVDRTAWSPYTAPTVSASYVQAELQAIANAVQANSRHLAALQQDITDHGLIGA